MRELWIAFKNYYLRDEGQHWTCPSNTFNSCELLSKIIIFVMKDNTFTISEWASTVVNCFQKLLSSWWRTTYIRKCAASVLLWIAFKNYYLRDEGQPHFWISNPFDSCELLSKIIIFVMKDNIWLNCSMCIMVVNCFQKLLSSWWRTTRIWNGLWLC